MAESSIYGSGLDSNQADYSPDDGQFGSGAAAGFGGGAAGVGSGTDALPPNAQPTEGKGLFGSAVNGGFGPARYQTDPNAAPMDAASSLLEQRIKRANEISSDPIAQILAPEQVQAARTFVPQAAEQLLKIKQQKAQIQANRVQADNLGLEPGAVADEADMAARVEVARQRALKGDLRVFKGLQAVDPKAAEAIAPQVQEAVAGHLNDAQYAFEKLSNMGSQGEYNAALNELRKSGSLAALESMGLKVPPTFHEFNATKAQEGQALREARIGMNNLRTQLEERNTYMPMEKKEAETYAGRLTTAYGDQVGNGTWSRNAAAGTRGFVVNGADDPRNLGKTFALATPDQRKEFRETIEAAIPKVEMEKYRAENRTYSLAVHDSNGKLLPPGKINTNPNVQQGIAEGLASMLRGGQGGANLGLLKIEDSKRGYLQALFDKIQTEKAGVLNTLKGKDVNSYLTALTESQKRDVLDALKQFNETSIGSRATALAERAGALGLKAIDLGLGADDVGGVTEALERGRQAQIARMMPYHQAIGGGDGVFQLGAQRPGAGAAPLPPGTGNATQQPGAPALRTPVQQATTPPGPGAPQPPAVPPPSAPPSQGPQGGGGGGGGPQTIAGQSVTVPPIAGVSPTYVGNMQRIESGNEKDPWKAGAQGSSAGGAFQFINSTWNENKPAGAPDRARDATPQQQAEALANLTAKNVKALQARGVEVTDRNAYIAHNVGAGAAADLLKADPGADARKIVGERAAANNPLFYKGRPTVATVLARYQAEMNGSLDDTGPKPRPDSGGATAATPEPSFMGRVRSALKEAGAIGDQMAQADAETFSPENQARATQNAASVAPAALSTMGAIGGGIVGGPPGAIAGGAAGGGVGQVVRSWLRGEDQDPKAIAKETALGGVLGIGGAARPVLGAAARAVGAGAVEAGAKAAEGGDAADVVEAGATGAAFGATGEAFGRALGMAGHKIWNMFGNDAKVAVRDAATKYADAEKVLASEPNRLPSVNGAAGGPNPKYAAAEQAKGEAETVLKDAGLNPEEAAYAARVSSEPTPRSVREAQVEKPGALAEADIGKGYQQLEQNVADRGVGAPKPSSKLPDGPIEAATRAKMSPELQRQAERTEMAITAPAPDWRTKWVQLKDERSKLLGLERDAMSSTTAGRTQIAEDYRKLADTVRAQQEKAAKYVFGETDGAAFMQRLKTLDVRYRNLMEATNGGDLAKAATLKGEAGREADRKFRAFAHDDPAALAAWAAMRRTGANLEQGVHDLVAAERIPFLGKVFSAAKLLGSFNRWLEQRASGSAVRFEDVLNLPDTGRAVRDVTGTAAARGATM